MAVATAVRQDFSTSTHLRKPSTRQPGRRPADRDLIALAIQGNESAFEMLYEAHRRRIYSLCLRMVHNVPDAEDLTQEAFLQAFRKLQTFRGDSAFSTWLHRLAVNVVLMRFRKRHVSELPLEDTPGPEDSRDEQPVLRSEDVSLSHSVDRITLERVISQLPPGYQLIFQLHDVLGYEHREIAEILDCSIGNSKSQLHKARLKLRDMLKSGKKRGSRHSLASCMIADPATVSLDRVHTS